MFKNLFKRSDESLGTEAMEEYNYEEFVKISQRLLKNRYRLNTEIAERIAYLVWDRIKSKDMRDVL
jgi:hypothetical protein